MTLPRTMLAMAAIGLAVFSPARTSEKDIVDTAVAAGSFKTLAKLVTDAGLVETLKGEGPFTVLAPTDAAFAKLPKKVVEAVVSDKALLTKVLTYHVISGKVLSTDLKNGTTKTVEGEKVKINLKKGVRFNQAKVIKADILASNGVIHVIDSVIIPPSLEGAVKKLSGSQHSN